MASTLLILDFILCSPISWPFNRPCHFLSLLAPVPALGKSGQTPPELIQPRTAKETEQTGDHECELHPSLGHQGLPAALQDFHSALFLTSFLLNCQPPLPSAGDLLSYFTKRSSPTVVLWSHTYFVSPLPHNPSIDGSPLLCLWATLGPSSGSAFHFPMRSFSLPVTGGSHL